MVLKNQNEKEPSLSVYAAHVTITPKQLGETKKIIEKARTDFRIGRRYCHESNNLLTPLLVLSELLQSDTTGTEVSEKFREMGVKSHEVRSRNMDLLSIGKDIPINSKSQATATTNMIIRACQQNLKSHSEIQAILDEIDGKRLNDENSFKDIAKSNQRLKKLTRNTLHLLHRESIEENITSVDLNNLAGETARVMTADPDTARGIEITLGLSPEKPKVKADLDILDEVFINIFKNAIQSCKQRKILHPQLVPEIKISTRVEDGKAVFEIEDNGLGLSAENMARIFQPNFTTKTSGMGLGMPISKRIIENYGGVIKVSSDGEMKGATVTVRLPLHGE
ncbi:MAG TPA: HAMP domain-containing histidine kinase [Candidatus Altiarchaeales archaeon]|nr:HAMP domain-containing histidine kinase [Candidatus Altiarchaeales archaeon]